MILGTVLKISATIVVDGGGVADSATVIIYDPDGVVVAPEESSGVRVMDDDSGTGIWEYVYQSSVDDDEGVYEYVILAVSGVYTARAGSSFKLEDKPNA